MAIRSDIIREQRKRRNLTVEALANRVQARCGVGSPAQVRRWESGRCQPSLLAAQALADEFGVKITRLLSPLAEANPPSDQREITNDNPRSELPPGW